MDMAFLRRAKRMLVQDQPVRIDHSILVAALAAQREAHAGPPIRLYRPAALDSQGGEEPMVELLLGGPGWRRALWAQRGCFSRAEAGRRVNGW
jgi:hypothetical protein